MAGGFRFGIECSDDIVVMVVSVDVAVVVVVVVSASVVVAVVDIALGTVDNLQDDSRQGKEQSKTDFVKILVE